MRIALPTTPDGSTMMGGWGRAVDLSLVDVADGTITAWNVVHVGWNESHDTAGEGRHHADIVRFCREREITDVIVTHMGQGMVNTLTKLGLHLHQTSSTDARASVEALLAS